VSGVQVERGAVAAFGVRARGTDGPSTGPRASTLHCKPDWTLQSEAEECMFLVGRKVKTEIPAEWSWLIFPRASAWRSRGHTPFLHPESGGGDRTYNRRLKFWRAHQWTRTNPRNPYCTLFLRPSA
jgi:hypothetical protein